MVQPKVDVLIIGTGENEATTHIGKNILEIAHKHKINVEVLSTELVGLIPIRNPKSITLTIQTVNIIGMYTIQFLDWRR